MNKYFVTALMVLWSISVFAGVELRYELEGDKTTFLAQDSNLKVIIENEPWILFDIKNQKIFVIEDDQKKFVEMTKAELENAVGAANNLTNAFGKGKVDLKAMTQKKKSVYVNGYTMTKGTGTKTISNTKGTEYIASDAKGKAGKIWFSTEIAKSLANDIDYAKVIRQILDITTTQVMLDNMTAAERYTIDMLDNSLKVGKTGVVVESELKGKTAFKFIGMSKVELKPSDFKVPEGYTKKSIREFLGK